MSVFRLSARIAARSGLAIAATIFAVGIARIVLNRLFDGQWHADWLLLLKLGGTFGVLWFVVLFPTSYIRLRAAARVEAILTLEPSQADVLVVPLTGFAAMEYYCLILNRTFLVFIAPEGLYGWKAEGPRTTSQPTYFQPYAEMLKDPEFMRNGQAVRLLSQLNGGFFIPRSDILTADVSYKQKWGMGGVLHSGRVIVRLLTGTSREFILLGSVSTEAIQQRILRG